MRKQDVTASVAGALLGVHPWTTALALFNHKAGLSSDDVEDTPVMRRGRLLEPVAAELIRLDHPKWDITYPVNHYYRDAEANIGATPDMLIVDEQGRKGIVQIKTVIPYDLRTVWAGDTEVDDVIEPPLWIVVQALIEARLVGAEVAYVGPFILDRALSVPLIEVPIHDALYEKLKGDVAEFWQRIKDKRPYPPNYKMDGDIIAKRYPKDDGSEIDLSGDNELPEVLDRLIEARAAKSAAEEIEKETKAHISDKMGHASFARIADGRRISHKAQSRNVKCKHLDGAFCSQSQFRVIRGVK